MSIITEYIENLPPAEKAILDRLRTLVYEVEPTTEDSFSYGIPTYKYKKKYLVAFASNKKFMSIYPGSEVIEILKDDLKDFKLSKGTISFTTNHPLPDELVRRVVLLAKDAIDQRFTK